MGDVLSVAKNQIRAWKEERIERNVHEKEEMKQNEIQDDPNQINSMSFNLKPKVHINPVPKKKQFIDLTEKLGRDHMSMMIGDKIIGKIFTDNINDFLSENQEDMEPIMNLCQIITRVLTLLKELDVK